MRETLVFIAGFFAGGIWIYLRIPGAYPPKSGAIIRAWSEPAKDAPLQRLRQTLAQLAMREKRRPPYQIACILRRWLKDNKLLPTGQGVQREARKIPPVAQAARKCWRPQICNSY